VVLIQSQIDNTDTLSLKAQYKFSQSSSQILKVYFSESEFSKESCKGMMSQAIDFAVSSDQTLKLAVPHSRFYAHLENKLETFSVMFFNKGLASVWRITACRSPLFRSISMFLFPLYVLLFKTYFEQLNKYNNNKATSRMLMLC
jgi:hypothetical protein